MKKEDWESLVRNLFALLCPGGYLHWEDVTDSEFRPVVPLANGKELRLGGQGASGVIRSQLRIVLRNSGFTDVDEKTWNTYGVED
ncbi:hypothetical protein CI238_06528 [Colletotrichum incanum]|uniref:Methyltransferase domain-containing protein n=1 Tax=Colletotrichum incanum TaxID=1573173 RepID=A0A167AJ62_COLIC|nr:hypothetical protein CI238_06528 [Colletotrichum incanum]